MQEYERKNGIYKIRIKSGSNGNVLRTELNKRFVSEIEILKKLHLPMPTKVFHL